MRTRIVVVWWGALTLTGCGAGVSLYPLGERHPDAPVDVLSVDSADAGTDGSIHETSDAPGRGDASDAFLPDDAGDAPPPSDASEGPGDVAPRDDATDAPPSFDAGAESREDSAPDVLVTDGAPEAGSSPDSGQPLAPQLVEFPVPTLNAYPAGIALGPDGNVWFTEMNGNKIGRITSGGTITEFDVPTPSSSPDRICAGPDNALWFSELSGGKVGRISGSGEISEFDLSSASPDGITAGPDGNIWFSEMNKIARMTPLGQSLTEFAVPSSGGSAAVIVSGSDGNLWVTDIQGWIYRVTLAGIITSLAAPTPSSHPIGLAWNFETGRLWFTEGLADKIAVLDPQRVDSEPTAAFTEVSIPTSGGNPLGIAVGPDGTVWFTEYDGNRIGSLTKSGVLTEFGIPTSNSHPLNIVADLAGNLWFTENTGNNIGRLSPTH